MKVMKKEIVEGTWEGGTGQNTKMNEKEQKRQ
jgi:hypothetical protein